MIASFRVFARRKVSKVLTKLSINPMKAEGWRKARDDDEKEEEEKRK
jgi:hypothetical protein